MDPPFTTPEIVWNGATHPLDGIAILPATGRRRFRRWAPRARVSWRPCCSVRACFPGPQGRRVFAAAILHTDQEADGLRRVKLRERPTMRGSIVAVVCLVAPVPVAGEPGGDENLFFIQRSKNRNEVHYDANIEDCRFRDTPVEVYWRDLEQGPDVRSGLKFWEGPAYGFDAERVSDTRVEIQLNATPERPITAELTMDGEACELAVEIEVNGQTALFRQVYVHATEGFWIWDVTVDYVDIHGYDGEGRPVVERIVRSERGRSMGEPSPIP
jgi:hypothetical protein